MAQCFPLLTASASGFVYIEGLELDICRKYSRYLSMQLACEVELMIGHGANSLVRIPACM